MIFWYLDNKPQQVKTNDIFSQPCTFYGYKVKILQDNINL